MGKLLHLKVGCADASTNRLSLHAGREATALDRKRRIVVVSNGLPEMIRRDVAHAGSLPEEASSSSYLPAWIEIVQALGDSPALRGILGRPRPPGGCQSLRQLVVEHQQPAERTQRSPDSTGHLFVLFFFFLFSFFLRTKLGLFLLFLFAFISFPLITHIRFSLLEPTFPKWRRLSNVTEPPHRYCTHFQQAHARSTRVIRVLGPNNARHSRAFSQLRAVVSYAAQTVTVVPNA